MWMIFQLPFLLITFISIILAWSKEFNRSLWSIDSSVIKMSRVKIFRCRSPDSYLFKWASMSWKCMRKSSADSGDFEEGRCCLCVLCITPSRRWCPWEIMLDALYLCFIKFYIHLVWQTEVNLHEYSQQWTREMHLILV